MHGTRQKGKLPPVVERALSWYAGHGGDGSENCEAEGRILVQRAEGKPQTPNAERRTPNAERRKSKVKSQKSNIERLSRPGDEAELVVLL